MYISVESHCCTPETNIILYVNYNEKYVSKESNGKVETFSKEREDMKNQMEFLELKNTTKLKKKNTSLSELKSTMEMTEKQSKTLKINK